MLRLGSAGVGDLGPGVRIVPRRRRRFSSVGRSLYTHTLMAGAGFEPAKAEPTRLQRVPFDRSGTPPNPIEHSDQRGSVNGSGRPGSISNSEYFGPPRRSLAPPSTSPAGINQRLPSPTKTKSQSQRRALNRLTMPFQLRFPPLVHTATSRRSVR